MNFAVQERLTEAEQFVRQELRLRERAHGLEADGTQQVAEKLSSLLIAQGKLDEAVPLLRHIHGTNHARTLFALKTVAHQLQVLAAAQPTAAPRSTERGATGCRGRGAEGQRGTEDRGTGADHPALRSTGGQRCPQGSAEYPAWV